MRLNRLEEEEVGVTTLTIFPALKVAQEVAVSLTFTGVGWLTRHTFTKPTS